VVTNRTVLQFDCSSTNIQLPFDCSLTKLRPFYVTAYNLWAVALRPR